MKVKKTTGTLGHERLHIKAFKSVQDMYAFLNKQSDNEWQEYHGELKQGIYAFAGGVWHNVKKLDPTLLAHI